MLYFRQAQYHDIQKNRKGVLVGDIGGTNSNFGLAQVIDGTLTLVCSFHIKSKEIGNFSQTVSDIVVYLLQTQGITITDACFAVAGIVSPAQTSCKPTNLNIIIDAQDIALTTKIGSVNIVNDFDVIGYGISKINPRDVITIQQGKEYTHGNKAILGAGTGLGKAMMHWVQSKNRYVSVASEGGHADFAAQTKDDLDLITYIKSHETLAGAISWEHVLSGSAIGRIFNFVSTRTASINRENKPVAPPPDEIFQDKNLSAAHQETAQLYAKLYARCAKNWALDTLALAGIYIVGGIAAHNVDLFKLPCFLAEFTQCNKQHSFLSSVPIWVIADYNISLYGAVEYMRLEGRYETDFILFLLILPYSLCYFG